jgi:hypothetical protein
MIRFWSRLQLAYLGVFLAASAAILIYQAVFIWPAEHCEAQGGWWAPKYHQCATPMPIWRITGRLPGSSATTAKPH